MLVPGVMKFWHPVYSSLSTWFEREHVEHAPAVAKFTRLAIQSICKHIIIRYNPLLDIAVHCVPFTTFANKHRSQLQGACGIIFPIIKAEGVRQMFFPATVPAYYRAPPEAEF